MITTIAREARWIGVARSSRLCVFVSVTHSFGYRVWLKIVRRLVVRAFADDYVCGSQEGINSMRIVTLLLVLSTLAGCAQTAGGASSVREDYYGGDGGFYAGAVAPR